MSSHTKTGFTIIESMLFLAISALVFVVGFAGIGARLEAVRYTDSVRNLESDVETVFRNTDDGLNLRPDDTDSNSQNCEASNDTPLFSTNSTTRGQIAECAVAGVDISFDTADRVNFSTESLAVVTGQDNGGFEFFTAEQINENDFDIDPYLKAAAPIAGTGNVYDLLWGLEYQGYKVGGGTQNNGDVTVRYIRSPISTQTFIYSDAGAATQAELTQPLHLCFADDSDRSATLTFESSATISVAYQGGECDTS